MKHLLFAATFILLQPFVSSGQEFSSLYGVTPLTFTSTGSGTFNKTVLYHDATNGLLLDLAKSTDNIGATPIDFKIDARGGGHNFFTIKGSNGNVGIGTNATTYKLHVKGAFVAEGDGAGNYADLNLKNGNVRWHISGPRYGDNNRLGIFWHDGSAYHDHFTITTAGKVGIGTNSPDAKLTVAGDIHSREVKVTIGAGSDFVFHDGYDLRTLKEVEEFIKENKHLPDIESAREMEEKGLDLGKMDMKLLQKIEELTLYMIEFKKEMNGLINENEKLKERIMELERK
jgi:hypothetical protein